MARFIVFTEVDENNQVAGSDIAINADRIVGFIELEETTKNQAGEDRPQCRLYLSDWLSDGENFDRASYIDVLGSFLDTQTVLNYRPGRGDE